MPKQKEIYNINAETQTIQDNKLLCSEQFFISVRNIDKNINILIQELLG